MTKQLEFCFDFISPYSFVAFHALPKALGEAGISADQVVYKPVFLGAIMQSTGNRPPGMVPAKGAYMMKDLSRSCARLGISLKMNPHFPMMNTRPVLRIACALASEAAEQETFIRTIFHHVWSAPEPLKTDDMDQVKSVCDAEGLDGAKLAELGNDPKTKEILVSNTDSAIERGAFGAPSFFVGDELYFGHDRLGYALEDLRS